MRGCEGMCVGGVPCARGGRARRRRPVASASERRRWRPSSTPPQTPQQELRCRGRSPSSPSAIEHQAMRRAARQAVRANQIGVRLDCTRLRRHGGGVAAESAGESGGGAQGSPPSALLPPPRPWYQAAHVFICCTLLCEGARAPRKARRCAGGGRAARSLPLWRPEALPAETRQGCVRRWCTRGRRDKQPQRGAPCAHRPPGGGRPGLRLAPPARVASWVGARGARVCEPPSRPCRGSAALVCSSHATRGGTRACTAARGCVAASVGAQSLLDPHPPRDPPGCCSAGVHTQSPPRAQSHRGLAPTTAAAPRPKAALVPRGRNAARHAGGGPGQPSRCVGAREGSHHLEGARAATTSPPP